MDRPEDGVVPEDSPRPPRTLTVAPDGDRDAEEPHPGRRDANRPPHAVRGRTGDGWIDGDGHAEAEDPEADEEEEHPGERQDSRFRRHAATALAGVYG